VSSNKGGSKFVSFGNGLTASSSNHYHAVFSTTVAVSAKPASIALHVGCGGAANNWWSDNWTATSVSVTASPTFLDATCNEGTTKSTTGTKTNKTACSFEPVGTAIANAAKSQIGVSHYCLDGGTITGPSRGNCSVGIVGFDCTGLVIYALYQATGINLTAYHNAAQATHALAQAGAVRVASDAAAALKPGDLLYFGPSFSDVSHVAIYVGGGAIVDANTNIGDGNGTGVGQRSLSFELSGPHRLYFVGAVRY
jgi:cell wall-associated NlpC family hydrolase